MADTAEGAPLLADPGRLARIVGLGEDDPSLLDALQRATGRFQEAVGHLVVLTTDDTVELDGEGGQTLILPAFPVANLAVSINGTPVTDYQVDKRRGILRRPAGWPDGLGNIQVTYDHGFAIIPEAIADAVLEAAQVTLTANPAIQTRAVGISSVTFGTAATVGTTQKWADAVAAYRRR